MNRRVLLPLFLSLIAIFTNATTPSGSGSGSPTASQMTAQTNTLEEIRDALTDDYSPTDVVTFPQTWGYANVLSGIDPNQASSEGLAQYWSGQNEFANESINRIQFSQIIIDLIITRGVLATPPPTATALAFYNEAYTSITGASLPVSGSTYDPIIVDIKTISENQTYLPIALTNLLVRTYELIAAANSCGDYWGDPQSAAGGAATPPTGGSAAAQGAAGATSSIANTAPSVRISNIVQTSDTTAPNFGSTSPCDCAKCSATGMSGYNGYHIIRSDVAALKVAIDGVCTPGVSSIFGGASFSNRAACRFLKTQTDKGVLDIPANGATEAEGEAFIKSLPGTLNGLMAPIQTLVLMQIDEALSSGIVTQPGGYPTTSFSSIYSQQTPTTTLPSCGTTTPLPVPFTVTSGTGTSVTSTDVIRCRTGSSSNPGIPADENLDTFIDNLVGMNSIAPPIIPGMPLEVYTITPINRGPTTADIILATVGMPRTVSTNPQVTVPMFFPIPELSLYIAGTKVDFVNVTIGSQKYWRSRERRFTTTGMAYLFIPEEEGNSAKTLRKNIQNSFYSKREGFQAGVAKSLMAKSSALDVISEIRKMNTVPQSYKINNGAGVYSKTPMQILQESSQWRLKPSPGSSQNSWLHEVSTMSNVSLLRELAVLLAEMRQMQYLQLQASQKELLVQAITSTSGVSSDGNKVTTLKDDVSKFAAGVDPNPGGSRQPTMPASP